MSSLYTGINSASYARVKETRKEIKDKKIESKAILQPSFEKLVEDLTAEIESAWNVEKIVTGGYVSDDQMRFELAARTRYVAKLKEFRSRYTNTVKGLKDGQQ